MAREQQRLTCLRSSRHGCLRSRVSCRLGYAASYSIGRRASCPPTTDTVWEESVAEAVRLRDDPASRPSLSLGRVLPDRLRAQVGAAAAAAGWPVAGSGPDGPRRISRFFRCVHTAYDTYPHHSYGTDLHNLTTVVQP
eukprot:366355-Chlamydomonas_euryale.AAC.4